MTLFRVRTGVDISYALEPAVAVETVAREKEHLQNLQPGANAGTSGVPQANTWTTSSSTSSTPTNFPTVVGPSTCSAS